jgi:GNAT superfamily N-acetyltransferase
MSMRKVRKVPAPGHIEAYWGYLTNCYVCAEFRDKSVGSRLLDFVTQWAKDEKLEFLVVWPSDRSYLFYERKGFRREPDPLVLKLTEE